MEIIYLAVPYMHSDPAVMEARFKAVTHVAGQLFLAGKSCFSPITHTHPIKQAAGICNLWESWVAWDSWIIEKACVRVDVLTLDGWEQSVGVAAELDLARRLGKPYGRLDPEEFGLVRHYTPGLGYFLS